MNTTTAICMATYQRPERVPLIIDDLNKQTLKNFELLIWNNSDIKLDVSKADFPVKVIESETNLGSKARFYLVKETKAEKIIFVDDDQSLMEDFVEYMTDMNKKYPKHLFSWFTRIFNNNLYWNSIPYSKENTEVDFTATCGMILDRELFDNNPDLYDIPAEYEKVEDLYLCYVARKNGYTLKAAAPKCKTNVDGKDQFHGLIQYKEDAFKKLRKEGWKLLNDK